MEPKCFAVGDGRVLIGFEKRGMSPPIEGTMPIPQADGTWIYPKPSEEDWEKKRKNEERMKKLFPATDHPIEVNKDNICPVCHQNTKRFLVWPSTWVCLNEDCTYNKCMNNKKTPQN